MQTERVKRKLEMMDAQLRQLESELDTVTNKRRLLVYQQRHPIWCNLMDFLPKELIEMCCEYYTFDQCLLCNSLFPKHLGRCMDCFMKNGGEEEISYRFDSEDTRHSRTMHCDSSWLDVTFGLENIQEMWNFLGFHPHTLLTVYFDNGHYKNESFEIAIKNGLSESEERCLIVDLYLKRVFI